VSSSILRAKSTFWRGMRFAERPWSWIRPGATQRGAIEAIDENSFAGIPAAPNAAPSTKACRADGLDDGADGARRVRAPQAPTASPKDHPIRCPEEPAERRGFGDERAIFTGGRLGHYRVKA
jgi:hypothetical protein